MYKRSSEMIPLTRSWAVLFFPLSFQFVPVKWYFIECRVILMTTTVCQFKQSLCAAYRNVCPWISWNDWDRGLTTGEKNPNRLGKGGHLVVQRRHNNETQPNWTVQGAEGCVTEQDHQWNQVYLSRSGLLSGSSVSVAYKSLCKTFTFYWLRSGNLKRKWAYLCTI